MIFRKTNNKYFQIFQNTLFLGHSGQYFPKLGEKCIFWEKGLCQFINIPNIYHVAKNLKKKRPIPDKNSELQMDRQTEDSDFIGSSEGQGSKKSYLNQKSATLFEREKIIVN